MVPVPVGSRQGNAVTASRWARLLTELGHEVSVLREWNGEPCDILVGLHARKSHASISRFARARSGAPLIVVLTGTDLYADLPDNPEARQSLELASRLVALQSCAADALPETVRSKLTVVYQSVEAEADAKRSARVDDAFQVSVLAHLRDVKDPLRAALAARLLPPRSRLRVVHAGSALEPEWEARARAEEGANPRYRWLGELGRAEALRLLARSHLLVLSSRLEGGANVVAEAVVASVPVVSSRIDGSVGMLGEDYPGYFPVGDTRALADLMWRAESDSAFYHDLEDRCERLKPRFEPAAERESWRALLVELAPPAGGRSHP